MKDYVASLLRTAVPTAWGIAITSLLAAFALPEYVVEFLNAPATIALVTTAVITGWYAVWRWAEPHIPAWLVTAVLGYAKAPTYQ